MSIVSKIVLREIIKNGNLNTVEDLQSYLNHFKE